MDQKQVWFGVYFKLDETYRFLSSLPEDEFKRSKPHELFMTWVVGRFLQARTSVEHFVGFPAADKCEGKKLSDFVFGRAALDNVNYDTVITNSRKPEPPMRIQVKRYMNRENATTDDLFNYICGKTARYGSAPEIRMIFHVCQGLKFDVNRFRQLARRHSFSVGAIWVFVGLASLRQKCALFEVHPQLSRVWWSPSPEDP